jgi:transcriptional regulator GlxA family with amidase domain
MSAPRPRSEIGLLIYPGAQLAAVHGLTDLFAIAERFADGPATAPLRVTHWRAGPETTAVTCVYDSSPDRPPPRPDILVVPLTLVELPEPAVRASIAAWLLERRAEGAALGSVCSGVFLLAETGLLAGRAACTHWSCAEELAARFPDIEVDVRRRLIDHGDIVMASGFMAWVDLGLRLVERLLGPAAAAETGRYLSVEPESVERSYLHGFTPRLSHGDAAVLRAQYWVHAQDARAASVAAMAEQARLERRTFLRRFAKATGMTPTAYCRQVRIARARELLEFSNRTVKEIAWEVGYEDASAFARVFQRVTGVSPGGYRKRFSASHAHAAQRSAA